MNTCLSYRTHIAKKDHEDSAGVWIREQLEDIRQSIKMEFSEWRAIAKLKANNWKIKKGQKYEYYSIVQDGDFYAFKCLAEIHRICIKYEIYQEE